MLLRTDTSNRWGIEWARKLDAKIDALNDWHNSILDYQNRSLSYKFGCQLVFWSTVPLFGGIIGFGGTIVLGAIRILSVLYSVIQEPRNAISAIPKNWRLNVFCVDLATAPEVVPSIDDEPEDSSLAHLKFRRIWIEIVPTDGVKYEIDKHSGYLMVDRPQRFSSFCPTLYGFVPRTYCGDRVAAYTLAGSPPVSQGDGDPLDICVLTDRPISRGEILLDARPIGGLRMVERGEADDKILAVLLGDPTYGEIVDVSQLPRPIIDRLRHYFLTYKALPGDAPNPITVDPVYDAMEARGILAAARADYAHAFPE